MTLAANDRVAFGVGNGVSTVFFYDFPLEGGTELEVYLARDLVIETAYTINYAAQSVTFSVAPAYGVEVILNSDTEVTQLIAYSRSNNSYQLDFLEKQLDRFGSALQELKRDMGRTVRTDFGEPGVVIEPGAIDTVPIWTNAVGEDPRVLGQGPTAGQIASAESYANQAEAALQAMLASNLAASIAFLPRVAPSAFNGTTQIKRYIPMVKSCTGPLQAHHTIDIGYEFEQEFGEDFGAVDVYLDEANVTGFASDTPGAGRGQPKLPYSTMSAAIGHPNRRDILLMGSSSMGFWFPQGSNQLIGGNLRPRPLRIRPANEEGIFTLKGLGETAWDLQKHGAGFVQAGDFTNLWEKTPPSAQLIAAVFFIIDGVKHYVKWEPGRVEAAAAEYAWYQHPTTKVFTFCWAGRNIARDAEAHRIHIVWARGGSVTFEGLPVMLERIRFAGLAVQGRAQDILLAGGMTRVKPQMYFKQCASEDSTDHAFKILGGIAIHQETTAFRSAFDAFNGDPDGVNATRSEIIVIDSVVRDTGKLESRALENNAIASGFSLRNLQALSAHLGCDALVINPDADRARGQISANTGPEQKVIHIGPRYGHPIMNKVTNPDAAPSLFRTGRYPDYDEEYPAAEIYGEEWWDGGVCGGPSSQYGVRLISQAGSIPKLHKFNSSFTGTLENEKIATPLFGVIDSYNPANPG